MKKLNAAVDRFAYSHPRFGIPNLMKIISIGTLIVFFLLRMSNYQAVLFLVFDPGSVLHGEIWRVLTFIFMPQSSEIFMLAISLYFYYWMGSLLEREWGTPKFTLYYLSGMALTIVMGFIIYLTGSGSGAVSSTYYINMSMFLAFAALYPDMQVMLFFFIPIKVKWLALLDVALFAVDIISSAFRMDLLSALLPVVALLNFLVFFWTEIADIVSRQRSLTQHKNSHQTIQFKAAARQQEKKAREQGYHHKCAVCGRTDTGHPELQFRYCSRCAGYHCFCEDHIFNHEHFTG